MPPPEKKQSDSDKIRKTDVSDYIKAHSHPNGGSWWKGFLKSNLFVALVLWVLAQVSIVVGMFWRVSSLSEWRGSVDSDIKTIKQQVAEESYDIKHHSEDIAALREADKEIKNDTKRVPVLESEHARLTKDVENLKDASKK